MGATASSRVSLGRKVCFKTDEEPLHALEEPLSLQPVPEFQLPGTLLRAISGAWPFAEGEVWTPGRCSLLVFPAEARRERSTKKGKLEVSWRAVELQACSSAGLRARGSASFGGVLPIGSWC